MDDPFVIRKHFNVIYNNIKILVNKKLNTPFVYNIDSFVSSFFIVYSWVKRGCFSG